MKQLERLARASLPSLGLSHDGDNSMYFEAGSDSAASNLSGYVLEIHTSHYPMFANGVWDNIDLHVYDERLFDGAVKIATEFEKVSGKDATVTKQF